MKKLIDDFAKYAKEEFGEEISLDQNSQPDSFENIFGGTFEKKEEISLSEEMGS